MEVFAQLQSASPFYVAALVMGNALLLMIMRHIAKPFTRPKHYAASRITWKVSPLRLAGSCKRRTV
jgi:hypothetical protein